MLWKNIMLKVILVSSNALRSSNLAKFYSNYLFLSWMSTQLLPCFPIVFPATLISHFPIIVHCMNNIDIDCINLMNEVKKKNEFYFLDLNNVRGYFKIEHEEKINTREWRVSNGVMTEYHRTKIWNETNET